MPESAAIWNSYLSAPLTGVHAKAGRKWLTSPSAGGRRRGGDARAQETAAETLDRPGGDLRHAPGDERRAGQLVVAPEHEPREDRPAEPARADAVAGVTGAVVDPLARDGAEERQVVGGDVDRSEIGRASCRERV